MTRAILRQCVRLLFVALPAALVLSCGGGTDAANDAATLSSAAPGSGGVVAPGDREKQDEDDAQAGGGGVAGAPFEEDGGGGAVAGAPITIPDFTIIGADFEQQLEFIEDEFTGACGGTLCVEIVAVVRDVEGEPCEITDVPEGTTQRGSTVEFGIAQACDAEPSEETGSSEETQPSEEAGEESVPAEPAEESAAAGPDDG